jgi:GMP synthase (glutamine-hydrolysing)
MLTHPQIAILDYGSQVTHLLARAIRKLKVYSVILDPETPASELKQYKGIILSGGPNSVYDEGAPHVDEEIFNLGIPVLGICYGHQLLMHLLGGKVEPGKTKEYGKAMIDIMDNQGLLSQFGLGSQTQVWMSHGDTVTALAPGFRVLASTPDCEAAIIGNDEKRFYGLQFHPEVNHSVSGDLMLDQFLTICECDRDWEIADFLNAKLADIRNFVAAKNVFLLISGGVDSTVAYAILAKALGNDRVRALLVDNGFMRKGEIAQVKEALKAIGIDNLLVADSEAQFLEALEGVYDPETKRQIIGKVFLDVKDQMALEQNLDLDTWLLGQGTIYPDTIESGGTKHADKIKTHHNRVDQITKLIEANQIIEPLADLYKDEVRELGTLLGLPEALTARHPFPGPGLSVRALCTPDQVSEPDFAEHNKQIATVLASHGFSGLQPQILALKSVGVQGDGRTYRHPLVLSGSALEQNLAELLDLSTDLTNRFSVINRVLFDLDASDPESYVLLPSRYLTKERLDLLREVDSIFQALLVKYGVYQDLWQVPVVLVPVGNGHNEHESIVLRPVASLEAMTADVYILPTELLREFMETVRTQKLPISHVFYDLTHKPPGTIEWE